MRGRRGEGDFLATFAHLTIFVIVKILLNIDSEVKNMARMVKVFAISDTFVIFANRQIFSKSVYDEIGENYEKFSPFVRIRLKIRWRKSQIWGNR
jgi:hypothetical protein